MTPLSIVDQAKQEPRSVEDSLFDFVTQLESEGKSPTYIQNYLKVVRSWLQFNGITLHRRIKVGDTSRTPTLEDERVPRKDELAQIISYAKPRGKTSICLVAFSGLRPQVLGNYSGLDGLQLRDLPELIVKENRVMFETIPTMVVVRPELSKAKHRYFTFLGPEGCQHLQAYLEKRIAEGETLNSGSPVISFKSGYGQTGYDDESHRSNRHVTTKTLTKEIRDAMRPRYTWRPYVLRAYFDTQLLIAENNGKIANAYRQFMMGHKGNIEARYTTNKSKHTENFIEDIRKSYQRCLEYLETNQVDVPDDKLQNALRRQLLLVAGFTVQEIDTIDLEMGDEEFQELTRKKLVRNNLNGNSQKVIPLDELAQYLDEGWSFVATIKNEQAIVKIN
jgi:hypothetical protein